MTNLPPDTTKQEDMVTQGQRRINLIWETTQAIVTILVVASNMAAALYNVFTQQAIDVPTILSSSLFLILGFYYSRTNHQAIGGTGAKADRGQEYKGR